MITNPGVLLRRCLVPLVALAVGGLALFTPTSSAGAAPDNPHSVVTGERCTFRLEPFHPVTSWISGSTKNETRVSLGKDLIREEQPRSLEASAGRTRGRTREERVVYRVAGCLLRRYERQAHLRRKADCPRLSPWLRPGHRRLRGKCDRFWWWRPELSRLSGQPRLDYRVLGEPSGEAPVPGYGLRGLPARSLETPVNSRTARL
jgi:hypothetical protein